MTRRGNWAPLLALALALAAVPALAAPRAGQAEKARGAASESSLRARVQAYLHRVLDFQHLDEMTITSISPPDASGIRTVKVAVAKGDQHAEQTYFISPDEREIMLGEDKSELSADPWRSIRAKLQIGDSPAEGAASAPVTIYEFSDLECPYCKEENTVLQQLAQQMPGTVRVVFKYFPLVKIHPWSMAAAEAAACVVQQNPAHFWPFEQATFDHQDQLTPADAASRLRDFALESGSDPARFDACMSSPLPRRVVERTLAEGKAVGVVRTPTLFVNGRPIPGAVPIQVMRPLVEAEAKDGPLDDTPGKLVGDLKGGQCGHCKPLPPLPAHPKQP
ncbi:MAG TPA: thioredoxin domain-containing protein [Terriglobales bacterium]|nr:thioredoxin domain-containing protein [Terriglobales bacterium]